MKATIDDVTRVVVVVVVVVVSIPSLPPLRGTPARRPRTDPAPASSCCSRECVTLPHTEE